MLVIPCLAVALSAPVQAKSPEQLGKIFAQAELCDIHGNITSGEKAAIHMAAGLRYNIDDRSDWFKQRITKKKLKAMGEIGPKWEDNPIGRGIACGVLKDRWL